MTVFEKDLAEGIFGPPALEELTEAFEKADRHLERLGAAGVRKPDRERVARQIISEARAGETQPELVWRAAVAKVLISSRIDPSRGDCGSPQSPGDIPAAGPHAVREQTSDIATPRAGALPSKQPGEDVDPATG